jgi:hypothetical protein
MIPGLATNAQMEAARILIGATMVAFLAAPMFRRQAQRVRMVITGLYFAGVLSFLVHVLF